MNGINGNYGGGCSSAARRWTVLLLLFALASSGWAAPAPSASNDTIRVVSWNIQWFPGRHPEADKTVQQQHREEVRPYLHDLQPDILLMQEIRDEENAQFLVDSVPGLTLHVATRFRRPDSDRSQQLVIASRYPARASFAEVFTGIYQDPEEEPYRGFAFAALESPLGGTLLIYSVHLKSNHGIPEVNIGIREKSMRQILKHVSDMKEQFAEFGPVTVVVGGDFNLLLEQEAMAKERTLDLMKEAGFHWAWEGVPFEDRISWPARGSYGGASFDHFLTWGLPPLTAKVLPKPMGSLSDHRPILLEIPTQP